MGEGQLKAAAVGREEADVDLGPGFIEGSATLGRVSEFNLF